MALSACGSKEPAPRHPWPQLSVSKANVKCAAAAVQDDLLLSASVAGRVGNPGVRVEIPGIDHAIAKIRSCNDKYHHPMFQVVLANLYAAGALAEASNDPPNPDQIDAYLNPGETFYAQAATYLTPHQARPFLDGAAKNLSAGAQLYKLAQARQQADQ